MMSRQRHRQIYTWLSRARTSLPPTEVQVIEELLVAVAESSVVRKPTKPAPVR